MGMMQQRLSILKTLIYIASGLSGLLVGAILLSELMILWKLPKQPDASLIALLQTIQTGFVGALGVLVGGLAAGIASYFAFRSAKETAGDETPSAP